MHAFLHLHADGDTRLRGKYAHQTLLGHEPPVDARFAGERTEKEKRENRKRQQHGTGDEERG